MKLLITIFLLTTLPFSLNCSVATTSSSHETTYYVQSDEVLSIKELYSWKYNYSSSENFSITVTVKYEGQVSPPPMFTYSKVIGNSNYSGTLSLVSYKYRKGVTEATYTGKLYLQK